MKDNNQKKYSSYTTFDVSVGGTKDEKEYEENNKLLKVAQIDDIKKYIQNNNCPTKKILFIIIIISLLIIIISIILSLALKKEKNNSNDNGNEIKEIENCLNYDKIKNECLSCASGYYLPNDDTQKRNCLKCSVDNCDKCSGSKTNNICTQCISCLTPIYQNNEIISCKYTCEEGENEKCKTCDKIKNMCSSCNAGYNLIDGKCILNNSIQLVFHSENSNEKIKIINPIFEQYIIGMQINNENIKPCSEYVFPSEGNHIIYLLMNITNTNSLNKIFYEIDKLTSITFSDSFDTKNIEDMSYMFYGCVSLTSINFFNFNTKNVKYMMGMFSLCSSLTSIDLHNFNTESALSMGGMFSYCHSLKSINITNFNTERVVYMSYMFQNCDSLTSINLSNFVTLSVENMNNMFHNCTSLNYLDISSFINYSYDLNVDCILCNVSNSGLIKVNKDFIDKIKNEIPKSWNMSIF